MEQGAGKHASVLLVMVANTREGSMDNKGWRGVPIAVLLRHLAEQPEHVHKMCFDLNPEHKVVETTQTEGQPLEVVHQPSEENKIEGD